MVKTIRKLACEEFLAAKYARAKLKSLQKGFIGFFLKIIATLLNSINFDLYYKSAEKELIFSFFKFFSKVFSCIFGQKAVSLQRF